MNFFLRPLLLAAILALAGCATDHGPKRPPFTGDPLIDGRNAIQFGPAKDKILWQCRVAAIDLRRGDFAEAKTLLDEAIPRIGGIIANDAEARKARQLFEGESRKTFLGEPYERVMAYYYRGLLYWMDGELDNARACFRSAQFQDADAGHHAYAADYVLLDYLDGYATAKLGGDGSDEWKRARVNAKNSAPPPYHTKANVLLFLEFGRGPVKWAGGRHGEQHRFREGPPGARSVALKLGAQTFPLVGYDDLYYQATTRGGRVMDHILANKAVFKTTTSAVGDAALVTSAALAGHREGEAALAVAGLAVLSKVLSASANAQADLRAWDNLPRHLSFAALELPPGPQTVTVDFLEAAGRLLLTKTLTFTVPATGRDVVLFVSDRHP